MKKLKLTDIAPYSGKRVQPFDGVKRYMSTGDLIGDNLSFEDVTYQSKPSRADILVSEGDILFAKMRNTNKALLIDKELDGIIVSTGFSVHKPLLNKLFGEYFLHFLKHNSFQRQKNKLCTGAIQSAITNNGIEKILVPVPEYEDQLHIANILSKAENLIAQRKESIRLLDEFLKSTFLEMFGDIQKMKKMKSENFSNYIEFLTSGSRGWAKYYSNTGAKFLRIQNVWKGTLRTDELQYVSPPATQEATRTKVKEGDLLITITADLGRTAVVPKNFGEAYINQHIALVRLKKQLNPIYAAYYFFMPFGYLAIQKKNKSAVKSGLTFNDIKTLPIIGPPIELQNQFAQIVENTEALKSQYQQSLQELENLYGSLSQKAFRGELTKK